VHPNDIRASFLKYFERHGHRAVPSSPLVPGDDPTLLFTNAGMNQFKDVFLGREQRDYRRAATAQKCMRVSGKHNDLDNVGPSLRHHTFFEMLGNFSFGDYFKADAIPFAWQLLTGEWQLDPTRLVATIFKGDAGIPRDDEAYDVWRKFLPPERIGELGLADNFWAMGDTGPCGRCSEIYYDRGPGVPGTGDFMTDADSGSERFVEIWNNVFMEFERGDGSLTDLPARSIDTGMGLERIAAVMQGTQSNYDTELFQPILRTPGCRWPRASTGVDGARRRVDAGDRRPPPRDDVSDCRRRGAVQRMARVRVAQDHAARHASRPQARVHRSLSLPAGRRRRPKCAAPIPSSTPGATRSCRWCGPRKSASDIVLTEGLPRLEDVLDAGRAHQPGGPWRSGVQAVRHLRPAEGLHRGPGVRTGTAVRHKARDSKRRWLGPAREGARQERVRNATRRNHTGTHLLHAALRQVLGPHVKQAGSLVAPDRLRFDFVHFSAITPEELARVEHIVNEAILADEPVTTAVRDTQEAIAAGAMALFGEKYGDKVRVVSVGDGTFSTELCGGTHVAATGQIGAFLITEESGVAAGVRRIEALTGLGALAYARPRLAEFERVRGYLNAGPDEVLTRLEARVQTLEKAIKDRDRKLAKAAAGQSGGDGQRLQIGDVTLVAQRVDDASKDLLRSIADQIKSTLTSGVVFLAGPTAEGKVAMVASVTGSVTGRLKAGQLVKELAPIVGGGGGGRPDFAEAGGKDPAQVDAMLAAAPDVVRRLLGV
jgi:alanyl-tRNA synthetase